MAYIPAQLRQIVSERANFQCEYCQTQELITGGPMHIEHIWPEAQGGATESENLAYSCARCNLRKSIRTHFRDPVSNRFVPLFNPRRQKWSRHFAWSDEQIRIVGLTRVGRATVIALQMNHPTIVMSRSIWADLEIHPPRN